MKKKKLKSQIRKYHKLMRLQANALPKLGSALLDMLHILGAIATTFDAAEESYAPQDFYDH